ncbi:phage tail tape measure protein [Escherichia coli]|nr:phage tail tape measure protein [Escherichia coli]
MSNVSGIGDAYYWSVFKIAEAFGLHRDTVKKRLLAANTPVAATVRGNPVYALQHVGPALFSVKHEAADSVHDPSRMGDQQRQRYQVQLSLRQKYQQQLEQLRRDSEQKGTYNTDDYRKAEQALTESLNRQLNENRRYWQQLEVVQGNWKNGVLRAFQDFTVDADNTAGTAEQVFSSAFSNMGNGLATFVTTGKLNFKSFTSSVLSDMAKILAQATMMKSIKGIGSVLGFDLSSLSLNANGGIYQSADLSRYSGTVVNRPTFFAFAKGAGVMGEAGPEAILPLRRGADGKLGVVADIGGSGMAMFAPQYNIEINNDGTNGQIGPAALKVVYDLGKKAAADFMQQQARDGGRLSGAYR